MSEEKHMGKDVAKSMAGIGIGIGLAKAAMKLNSNLLGMVANVFISSGMFKGANAVTDMIVDKVLGNKKPPTDK